MPTTSERHLRKSLTGSKIHKRHNLSGYAFFYLLILLFLLRVLLAVYEPKREKTIMSSLSPTESKNGRPDEKVSGRKSEMKTPYMRSIPPENAPEASHPSFVPLIERKPQTKDDKYKITAETGNTIAVASGKERSTALAKRDSTSEMAREISELFIDEATTEVLPLCLFCLFCFFGIIIIFLSVRPSVKYIPPKRKKCQKPQFAFG